MTEKAAKYIVKYHILIFIISALLLGLSIFGFTKLESGFGLKIWFSPTDPYLVAYEQYERDFGNDDSLVIIVHSPSGIYDTDSVQVLKEITDKMWQISDVIRVDSLSNHQLISNRNGDVVIEQIFPQETDEALISLRKEQTKNDEHIISYLISRDQTTAAIHAQLKPLYDKKDQYNNTVKQAKALVAEYRGRSDHEFHLAGPAALSSAFRDISVTDLTTLTPILFGIVILILLYYFRSLVVSVLLVGILALTIFMAFGFAGLMGIRFNSLTSCLPQILIAMTLAEGIHFLSAFFRFRNEGSSKKEAAEHSLVENLPATFMTSFTTALGFIAFAISDLGPVSELGIIASVAIMLCWFLTITLMPAFLIYLPAKVRPVKLEEKAKRGKRIDSYMTWVEKFRWPIIASWTAVFIASVICCFSIEINSDILNYFSKSTEISKANTFMQEHFGGARGLEIVFDTGKPDGVKEIPFLNRLIEFQDWVRAQDSVTKVTSLADIIEELNNAIDDGSERKPGRLPASNESVAQQLFLYSMSLPVGMGLNYWATLNYQKMRMKILWNIEDSVIAEKNMERFEAKARELGLDATITGKSALMPGMAHHLIKTFNQADLMALVMIMFCMIFMFRSLSIGLLSMVPNIVPPAFSGAIMMMAGVKYDVGTILVISVVMGIAVDDTIHFLTNYVSDKRAGKTTRQAIIDVFDRTGPSIMMTTVILVLGFSLGFFSEFTPYVNFGMLTAATLAFALTADLMLLPAILLVLEKKKSLHKKLFDA